ADYGGILIRRRIEVSCFRIRAYPFASSISKCPAILVYRIGSGCCEFCRVTKADPCEDKRRSSECVGLLLNEIGKAESAGLTTQRLTIGSISGDARSVFHGLDRAEKAAVVYGNIDLA